TDVEYLNGVVKVKRKLEKRIEVYELPIPCLLVVAMKSNEPRSVKLSYKLKAKMENCIEIWTNNELGLTRECIGLRGSPTRVEKSIATPSVPRKKQKFDGQDVKTAVKWLVDKLVEEGLKIV
ncbi:MAG: electron transfer flavoprotein subunit beta/FixA family protein, partial [Nitrososphaerota archaeon]